MVDQEADPTLYRSLVETFPDALIEDPILTDETRPLFEGSEDRISWDAPNDVAPRVYNDPEPRADLPTSPLSPPRNPRGLEWKHADWERIESRP